MTAVVYDFLIRLLWLLPLLLCRLVLLLASRFVVACLLVFGFCGWFLLLGGFPFFAFFFGSLPLLPLLLFFLKLLELSAS
jgi:hypothetical protein